MRIWASFIVLFTFATSLSLAQPRKIVKTLDTLKTSGHYFYALGEAESEDKAIQKARNKMMDEIYLTYRIPRPQNAGTSVDLEDLMNKTSQMLASKNVKIPFENFSWDKKDTYSSFVYVRKNLAQNFAKEAATAQLRNDEEVVWGESEHPTDMASAESEAKSNLILKIQQTIYTEQVLEQEEVNIKGNVDQNIVAVTDTLSRTESDGRYSESFSTTGITDKVQAQFNTFVSTETFKSQNRVFSKMTLNGLKTITLDFGTSKYSFAYISSPDLDASFKGVTENIYTLAKSGEIAEGKGDLGSALSSYFRAYIFTGAHYKASLPFKFPSGESTDNISTSLQSRIKDVIGKLEVKTMPAYDIDEVETVVPFEVTFGDKSISGLNFLVSSGSYANSGTVTEYGNLLKLFNFVPEKSKQTLNFKFMPNIEEFAASDPKLAELLPSRYFWIDKNVEIDFSNMYKINIEPTFDEYKVTLMVQPRLADIVKRVDYDFGDGNSKTEFSHQSGRHLKVTHEYDEKDPFLVRVKINGDDGLVTEKYLDFERKKLRNSPPKNCKNCSDVTTPITSVVVTYPEYSRLLGFSSFPKLFQQLKVLQDRGDITFGKQSDFFDPEGALIIVSDGQKVFDEIIFSKNRFFQIASKEEISSLKEAYGDKYLVWIKTSSK